MDRRIWTLYTGKKYPPFYPKLLANSLKPHEVDLFCLTDRHLMMMDENLSFIQVSKYPSGWWGKMKFFDSEKVTGPTLVCDIDSVFVKDPEPIFQWLEKEAPDLAFISEPINRRGVGTSLFFVNGAGSEGKKIWEAYLKYKPGPHMGDQDFINRHCHIKWARFPLHFQGQYKCFFPPNDRWQQIKVGCYGSKMAAKDLISLHFNGRPYPHEVIDRNMKGWKLIDGAIQEYSSLRQSDTNLSIPE